jgi:hypothetical protein
MDFLHPSFSGLCFGNIINTSFMVLAFLQLKCPSEPLLVKGTTQHTYNNAMGYCFPYGKLAHVIPPELKDEEEEPVKLGKVGDGLGDVVNAAVSSATWYTRCWDALKARGKGRGVMAPRGQRGSTHAG